MLEIDRPAHSLDTRDHFRVGLRRAGERRDHDQFVALGERAQQSGDGCRRALRQVVHERAELVYERAAFAHHVARGAHEIVLVVPRRREEILHDAMDADDLAGTLALRAEQIERGIVEVGQLPDRGDERLFGRRVRGHRREHPGPGGEHAPHGGRHDGRRDRPAFLGREPRRRQQLGEAGRSEEIDADQPGTDAGHRPERARRQQPPHRHSHGVSRNDNRHRCERRLLSLSAHLAAQRPTGGTPPYGVK